MVSPRIAHLIVVPIACWLTASCGDNNHLSAESAESALVVTPLSGLHTTEGGGTATFTVALSAEPAADVAITVASSNLAEGTVSPASITLTHENWNIPVTVTVTGVDDTVDDGDVDYVVHADGGVAGAVDVLVTNDDDDGVGISVTPTSGLLTTEGGGTATFTVVLTSQPLASVAIPIASANPAEGTATPATLTFTVANWNAPQTVMVTGVDDDLVDGAQQYDVMVGRTASTDPAYDGLDPHDVMLTNIDNDSPGVIVTPTSGLVTSEAGGSATFAVVLASQPTADVAIAVLSSDPGEGTAAPGSLTFTTANWNAPQIVTVTGVNDDAADGAQSYTIVLGAAASTDPGYVGVDPADVAVTNIDNDAAGIRGTPTSGLTTSESGTSDVFTVVLLSKPTANVTIPISSGDPTEGTVVPASLTFTPADFDVPKSVTVTGIDDRIADGNQIYQVVLAPAISADLSYAGMDPDNVTVVNLDDDAPAILVAPTSVQVSEFGDTDTFDIVLASQPTADVTITLTSTDLTEGTVSPASVTFTPANFNVPQTITVTGVDDRIADGNQVFTIITGAATSADPNYAGLDPADVTAINVDNESPNVYIKARKPLFTTESGGTATFRVRLTTQPVAPVTCTVASSDLTEGQVGPPSLVFSPSNFNQFQTVTIIGVDDAIVDGDQLYTIITAPCTSTDPAYNGLDPRDVSVINHDND